MKKELIEFIRDKLPNDTVYVDPQEFYEYCQTHPLCIEITAFKRFSKNSKYDVSYTDPMTKQYKWEECSTEKTAIEKVRKANNEVFNAGYITISPYSQINNIFSDPVVLGTEENLEQLKHDYLLSVNQVDKEITWGYTSRQYLNVLVEQLHKVEN